MNSGDQPPHSTPGRGRREESALVEGEDYYWEGPVIVFTAHFLRRRGYCCGNGCRHCPYREGEVAEAGRGDAQAN